MPNDNGPATHPALVSILRQGTHLIASIHTALDDGQLIRFQQDLIDRVGRDRLDALAHALPLEGKISSDAIEVGGAVSAGSGMMG